MSTASTIPARLYCVGSAVAISFCGCVSEITSHSDNALDDPPDDCAVLDFDTDGLGNPIAAGAIVEQAYAAIGVEIDVWWWWEGSKCEGLGVAFDTENPTGGDDDLSFEELGNVLINQEHFTDADIANGFVEEPDDQACGALFEISFVEPQCVDRLTLLDIDMDENPVEIRLFDDTDTLVALHYVDPTGDNTRVDAFLPASADCTVVFATVQLSSSGAIDNLTICPGPTNPVVGTRVFDGGRDDFGTSVAADREQHAIVGGGSQNAVDLDGVVRKYDRTGNLVWSEVLDGGHDDVIEGIAVDFEGNIIAVGASGNGSDRDLVVRKYDADGTVLWTRPFDGGGNDSAMAVAVDGDEQIVVAGFTTVGGGSDILIRKYDADGATLWTQSVDVGAEDVGYGVATDGADNVFVAGQVDNGSDYDLWLGKFDADGNPLWTRVVDGGGDDVGRDVAADLEGNPIVVGASFNGANADIYLRKYDPDGDTLWIQTFDGGGIDVGQGVATDSKANIIATGQTTSATTDAWTRKLDSSGAEIWTEILDRGADDRGAGVATDLGDSVLVTGWFDNGSDRDLWVTRYRP